MLVNINPVNIWDIKSYSSFSLKTRPINQLILKRYRSCFKISHVADK